MAGVLLPVSFELNGAALWNNRRSIKSIALIRIHPQEQSGYARRLAARHLGFVTTSCSAERNKSKVYLVCRSRCCLPTFGRSNEQLPVPALGNRNHCCVPNLTGNSCLRHLDCRWNDSGRFGFGLDDHGISDFFDRSLQRFPAICP